MPSLVLYHTAAHTIYSLIIDTPQCDTTRTPRRQYTPAGALHLLVLLHCTAQYQHTELLHYYTAALDCTLHWVCHTAARAALRYTSLLHCTALHLY